MDTQLCWTTVARIDKIWLFKDSNMEEEPHTERSEGRNFQADRIAHARPQGRNNHHINEGHKEGCGGPTVEEGRTATGEVWRWTTGTCPVACGEDCEAQVWISI